MPPQRKLQFLSSLTTNEQRSLLAYLRNADDALVPISRGARNVLGFPDWLREVTPSFNWQWSYLKFVQGYLDRVTSGEINRLMLFVPPRHGKSEMTTIRYPVWRLERNPELRVIVAAYNATLASRFSRKSRKIARERLKLSDERSAADDWETLSGGGLRAVGVGGGVTGSGAHLIIIDDPVKSREEANSVTYRDRVWDWYTEDLYSRLEPGGSIILIMTRWHEDDLAGRIMASDDAGSWSVISLPALAGENDPLGRKPGDALCPERYDVPALERIRRVMGIGFHALYQQTPMPAEGDFFKRSDFRVVPVAPASGRAWWVRYWDKAATAGGGDYTAGVLMALTRDTNEVFVCDVVRGQWDTKDRYEVMKQTAERDSLALGENVVEIWIEQEGGSAGKDAARADIAQLFGYNAHVELLTGKGNKALRAMPFQAQSAVGNVHLVRGAWNPAYLDEMTTFPVGAHDDQVDASSGAFRRLNVIREKSSRNEVIEESPQAGKHRLLVNPGSLRGKL